MVRGRPSGPREEIPMGLTRLRRHRAADPNLGSDLKAVCYQMRRNAVMFGGDHWIEDHDGRYVYRIDGTRLGSRNFMDLENAHGDHLCRIRTSVTPSGSAIEIEHPNGARMAVVPEGLATPLRERWTVVVAGGPHLAIRGNVFDHEYTLESGAQLLAAVSRRWFRLRDTYGVLVAPGEDPVLLLGVSAALDAAAHPVK